MSFFEILGTVLIKPLELVFEVIYMLADKIVGNEGLAIIALSVCMNILVLPLYKRADAMQAQQQQTELALHRGVSHIKKVFKGDERMLMLQTYYRQNNYKPTYVLRGATSLLLEIPFFIAAYRFLSGLSILQGVSFGPIADLGKPDGLLHIAGLTINLLPIVMTVVNLISCVIFTKGSLAKTKIQLYGMAIFFLFFLYTSPSGLVFYWTLNNVFSLAKTAVYKLKYADITVRIFCALAGICGLGYGVFFYSARTPRRLLLFAAVALVLQVPLALSVLKKYGRRKAPKRPLPPPNKKLFFGAMTYLAAFTGLLIPSTIIKASPQEFVDVTVFYHPAWYIVSAACFAFGTFVVWAGIFYWLAGERAKVFFERGAFILCGAVTVDYMFFGRGLGNLSAALQYDKGMQFSRTETLLNLGVLCLVGIVLYLIAVFLRKYLASAVLVCVAALLCMGGFNLLGIFRSVSEIQTVGDANSPHITLDASGKNVIVLMLDRAMNLYLPYIFNEKPQLREQLAGFTVYENVLSYGQNTNFCTPALFGGYEYTPAKLNARSSERLAQKQNEALRVMPVLFGENEYRVTVFDPSYAGYQWIPDLSIYDGDKNVSAYNLKGTLTDPGMKKQLTVNNRRNFFCFSVMKSAPLLLQRALYDGGGYNSGSGDVVGYGWQDVKNLYQATGISAAFMNSYETLKSLSALTRVTNNGQNQFLMMTNDTTHDAMLLQEGEDYMPAQVVDNRDYEAQHANRFFLDGKQLKFKTEAAMANYQANVAALLRLGEWCDTLRAQGVYDNTRIILVSDHGFNYKQCDDMLLSDGLDIAGFYPILMVKDFGSTEFRTDDRFMTNADVPALAFDGLIENPVNPFTGNPINSDDKTAHDQYVILSWDWSTVKNNGNTFLPGRWYAVHDDVRLRRNWNLVAKDAVLDEEP